MKEYRKKSPKRHLEFYHIFRVLYTRLRPSKMGSSASKIEDPVVLDLADKYKFPKEIAKNIKNTFEALDSNSLGFLTKDDFHDVLNKLNPLSDRVLNAFFYPPDDLNPFIGPMESVDLEHFFKLISFFFHFPSKLSCKDCVLAILCNPKEVFKVSKTKKVKRMMILFRMMKEPNGSVITRDAFVAALEILKIEMKEGDLEKAFKVIENVSEKKNGEMDFSAFKKLYSMFQIDDIFVHEVRNDQTNETMVF